MMLDLICLIFGWGNSLYNFFDIFLIIKNKIYISILVFIEYHSIYYSYSNLSLIKWTSFRLEFNSSDHFYNRITISSLYYKAGGML